MKWQHRLSCLCALLGSADRLLADRVVDVRTREQLVAAVRAAGPGTTIRLAPGTYRGGMTFERVQGTRRRPIVITGADPRNPPVLEGGANGIRLIDPAYVKLGNLIITKSRDNGINIDDGGSYATPAHHVLLHDLVVRRIGSDGNHDGIKLSGLDRFRIENCRIEQWGRKGSGIDMVGCHQGLIVGCTFREGDEEYGSGVQMKGGSEQITVRACRFERAGGRSVNIGGSTGLPYFRPSDAPHEAKAIVVEDCTFVGSMAPVAFVGVDGAVVRHNTIYRPTRWVLRILQETGGPRFVPCRKGQFINNLILFQSGDIHTLCNVGGGTDADSFAFSGNWWFCMDRPDRTRRIVRLPVEETEGIYGRDPRLTAPAEGDFRPRQDSPARGVGVRFGQRER